MGAFTLNNGEKVRGTGLTVIDKKGKQILNLPPGASVSYTPSDNPNVAQFVQDPNNPLVGDITTEGDEVGIANITGTITWADGSAKSATAVITVVNSAPESVEFTPGTVEPE